MFSSNESAIRLIDACEEYVDDNDWNKLLLTGACYRPPLLFSPDTDAFYSARSAVRNAALRFYTKGITTHIRRYAAVAYAKLNTKLKFDKALSLVYNEDHALVREIKNPFFKEAGIAPHPTVSQVAEEIYQSKRFDELPVLADAVEEYHNEKRLAPLLQHLRQKTTHVKGCWALDWLLGK